MEPAQLLGKNLRLMPGTVRPQPDQDDAWFAWLAGKRKRLIDVGANIGYTAIIAALRGMDHMLLIDPNPEALTIAAANLIHNNLASHCGFLTAFVSDVSDQELDFYTVGAGAAGSMYRGHAVTASKLNSSFKVRTKSLDDICEKLNWAPDFVKIDVEGAEVKVLWGACMTVQRFKPWIMVEMHSPPELPMAENARLVLDWCKQNGYHAWYMKDAILLTTPDQIGHRGKCHLLLLPQHEEYPSELTRIPQRASLDYV